MGKQDNFGKKQRDNETFLKYIQIPWNAVFRPLSAK